MTGEAERDEGMARAERNAHERWKERARACLEWLNSTRETWTTDDFWIAMREHYPEVVTHELRALGPLLNGMLRRGEMAKLGQTTSSRPEAHKAILFIYGRPRDAEAEVKELAALVAEAVPTLLPIVHEAVGRFLHDRGVRLTVR